MSMNFNIYKGRVTKHSNGDHFNCWQTPTSITEMIMASWDGTVVWELTGKKALHSIEIYKLWIKGKASGVYESNEQLEERRKEIENHLKELDAFLGDKKNIRTVMI